VTKISAAVIAVAMSVGTGVGTAGAAQGDPAAFCQARVDVERAFVSEDRKAARRALATLEDAAPPEVAEPVGVLVPLLEKRGGGAFETRKGAAAGAEIDQYAVASCGFPVLDVTALDYSFEGIPAQVTAGTQVIQLTNEGAEPHELLLLQRKPGNDDTVEELLELPERKLAQRVQFVAATFAEPGQSSVTIPELEPGSYVAVCSVPTDGKRNDPHWKHGMVTEFDVVGGA
jgi:hypothetical protein